MTVNNETEKWAVAKFIIALNKRTITSPHRLKYFL